MELSACAMNVISVKMGYPGFYEWRMDKCPDESFHRIAYAPDEVYVGLEFSLY